MPSPKSPSGGSRRKPAARSSTKSGAANHRSRPARGAAPSTSSTGGDAGDGVSALAEQFVSRLIRPLGLVVLTRERIQEVLDDAAARGRVTHTDANELVAELVNRGRQQTDQLLSDVDRLLSRGRQQIGSATIRARRSESLDLLLRSADRARRSVGAGSSFPVLGYDELTAAQVPARLDGLSPAELRRVRDYERRHANRKSVLAAIDRSLSSD
jgi:polyhydroxyalkanoate synthesis regulator phasin